MPSGRDEGAHPVEREVVPHCFLSDSQSLQETRLSVWTEAIRVLLCSVIKVLSVTIGQLTVIPGTLTDGQCPLIVARETNEQETEPTFGIHVLVQTWNSREDGSFIIHLRTRLTPQQRSYPTACPPTSSPGWTTRPGARTAARRRRVTVWVKTWTSAACGRGRAPSRMRRAAETDGTSTTWGREGRAGQLEAV